jgi:hypothetical protein
LRVSGSVSITLEQQGIADPSDIPRGRGKENKESIFKNPPLAFPLTNPIHFNSKILADAVLNS